MRHKSKLSIKRNSFRKCWRLLTDLYQSNARVSNNLNVFVPIFRVLSWSTVEKKKKKDQLQFTCVCCCGGRTLFVQLLSKLYAMPRLTIKIVGAAPVNQSKNQCKFNERCENEWMAEQLNCSLHSVFHSFSIDPLTS